MNPPTSTSSTSTSVSSSSFFAFSSSSSATAAEAEAPALQHRLPSSSHSRRRRNDDDDDDHGDNNCHDEHEQGQELGTSASSTVSGGGYGRSSIARGRRRLEGNYGGEDHNSSHHHRIAAVAAVETAAEPGPAEIARYSLDDNNNIVDSSLGRLDSDNATTRINASSPSTVTAQSAGITLNDLLSVEERRFPSRQRPFASSIDWTPSSRTNKAETLSIANEFIKIVVHNPDAGCIFFHSLEKYGLVSSSFRGDETDKKLPASERSVNVEVDDEDAEETKENSPLIEVNSCCSSECDSRDDNNHKDGKDNNNNIMGENLELSVTRSMALWKCEDVQKQNLANPDCMDILMKLLPLHVGFPKYSFWVQYQGREMDDLLRLQSLPQAERDRVMSLRGQQQTQRREIYDTDFIISREWNLCSSELKEECLACLIQLRRLAISGPSSSSTVLERETSSSIREQFCRDFDLYTRTSCTPEQALDVLEYSVWNSTTKYQKFLMEVPMAKHLFQQLVQLQQRSDREVQRRREEQEEGKSAEKEETTSLQPPVVVGPPKLWQKYRL